jgi:hypothetical protein
MDTDTILTYKWQHTVLDAFLELKPERLPEKVRIAEITITERLHDLQRPDERERAALSDALNLLRVIFPA